MRHIAPRARSWVLSAVPAILLLAGCDRSPTEPLIPSIETAKGPKTLPEMVAFSSNHEGIGERAIYTMAFDGLYTTKRVTNPGDGVADNHPDFAPGSARLAFTRTSASGASEIYTIGSNGKQLRQLTNFGAVSMMPVYSPDGTRIAFLSDKDGDINAFVMNVDGTNVQRVSNTFLLGSKLSWSANGAAIYFMEHMSLDNSYRLWRWTLLSGGEILMVCYTTVCTSPTGDYTSDRIIYEEKTTPLAPPILKLFDVATGANTPVPVLPARVGGWKLDGSRYVTVSDSTWTLQTIDPVSGAVMSLPTPGEVMWPTWSR